MGVGASPHLVVWSWLAQITANIVQIDTTCCDVQKTQIIVPVSTVNLERKGIPGIVLKIVFAALMVFYDSNSKLIA